MKKINVTPLVGTLGAPFLKQTFVHTDEQVKEVVDALVKGLIGTYTTNDLIILHGCVITGTTTKAITEGAIYYNGEVYLVDAASGLEAAPDTWIFAIVTTYAAGDPVTYDDGSINNQHQIDKIVFQVGDSGSDGYISDWDAATVKYLDGSWLTAGLTFNNSWTTATVSEGFKYRKEGNKVTFRGSIKKTFTTSTTLTIDESVITLPAGFRPSLSAVTVVCGLNGGDPILFDTTSGYVQSGIYATFTDAGDISIKAADIRVGGVSAIVFIFFDSIEFYIN